MSTDNQPLGKAELNRMFREQDVELRELRESIRSIRWWRNWINFCTIAASEVLIVILIWVIATMPSGSAGLRAVQLIGFLAVGPLGYFVLPWLMLRLGKALANRSGMGQYEAKCDKLRQLMEESTEVWGHAAQAVVRCEMDPPPEDEWPAQRILGLDCTMRDGLRITTLDGRTFEAACMDLSYQSIADENEHTKWYGTVMLYEGRYVYFDRSYNLALEMDDGSAIRLKMRSAVEALTAMLDRYVNGSDYLSKETPLIVRMKR